MESKRNNSKKRSAILEAICSTELHPTAESIYTAVKPLFPGISLGTVYRNISVLEQAGEIISVGTVNGQERFDGRTDNHAHFICRKCGSVTDVELSLDYEQLCRKANEASGCNVEHCTLSFTGLCENCCERG